MREWARHNDALASRCDHLNRLGLVSLEYHSSNGTDFKVGLIPDSVFMGGGEETVKGRYFNPNIPSEEIFISPKAGEAEGIVYSTKPLSYQGELIENFSVRFEGGRAVRGQGGKEPASPRKDDRDGRGGGDARRVRAHRLRFAHQQPGHPLLQHALR